MKTVTAEKLGTNGKKALGKLITAAKHVEDKKTVRSERLATFLIESHLEGSMLKQSDTATAAGCDRTMVSRMYRALCECAETAHKGEGKPDREAFEIAFDTFKAKGYTAFTNEFNPRVVQTVKSQNPDAHTIEDKQAGVTPEEKQAAKASPVVSTGGPDHFMATIAKFSEAYREGRIVIESDQRTDMVIALLELVDMLDGGAQAKTGTND